MSFSLKIRFVFWTAVYNVFGFLLMVAAGLAGMSLAFVLGAEKKLEDQEDETG